MQELLFIKLVQYLGLLLDVTDGGIISKRGRAWLESLGIQIRLSGAYSHHQNGVVERSNRFVQESFKVIRLEGEESNWTKFLPFVALRYNAGYSRPIGDSP